MKIRRRKNHQQEVLEKKPETRGRKKGLTRQQRMFAYEYLADSLFDPIKAYEKAGYKGVGPNKGVLANQVLQNPKVQKEIDRILGMRFESKMMDIYWIQDQLKEVADFRLAMCYKKDGTLKKPHEMDPAALAGLRSIKISKDGKTTDITAWDRLRAIELIGKTKQFFVDRLEIEASGLPQLTIIIEK